MNKEIVALMQLVILLPLICGLAYLTIRFGFGRGKSPVGYGFKKRMRVLEQVTLGSKCGLSMVQVGEKYMLFAHQEGSIALVKEMDELPAEIESTLTEWPGVSQLVKRLKPSGFKMGK